MDKLDKLWLEVYRKYFTGYTVEIMLTRII
jgi:hypothetical protein